MLVCSPLFPFPMLHNGLLGPIVCILIYALASGGGALGRLLSTRPFQLAGEASYSIYILQVPVWLGFSYITGEEHARGMADFLGYLIALIAISALVLQFIEIPGREMLKASRRTTEKRKPSVSRPLSHPPGKHERPNGL